jgi:hypothetical protein
MCKIGFSCTSIQKQFLEKACLGDMCGGRCGLVVFCKNYQFPLIVLRRLAEELEAERTLQANLRQIFEFHF